MYKAHLTIPKSKGNRPTPRVVAVKTLKGNSKAVGVFLLVPTIIMLSTYCNLVSLHLDSQLILHNLYYTCSNLYIHHSRYIYSR